jgi:small ligand-binding sensory domain FIST
VVRLSGTGNTRNTLRFHCAISDDQSSDDAARRVIEETQAKPDAKTDLAFLFFTAHHRDAAPRIVERLWLELDPQCLVGCCAEGVIGADREIEREPGIALLTASAPGVRLHPFHIAGEDAWRDLLGDGQALRERFGASDQTRALIAFGDPFTTPLQQLFRAVEDELPGLPIIGGMASAARQPGQNILVRNDEIYDEGMVGVSISGPIVVQTIVSQGCKPIGSPMIITRSHDNIIEQLGGKPPLQVLREIVTSMPEDEQQLLQNGLMLGQAMSEYRETFGHGDFVVRNVIDIDEASGAVAVADYVKTGQTVQFHVRDAQTADEDLKMMLESQRVADPAAGALLFSCNGRGLNMFAKPCHDITIARQIMPATPMAGFFAAGEFGPVAGKNFAHGHTASFALFRTGK